MIDKGFPSTFVLIPDDDPLTDSVNQRKVRMLADEYVYTQPIIFDLDLDILDAAVASIKANKAPGPDNIPGAIITLTFPLSRNFIYLLFNDCFRLDYFPDKWKSGKIITKLKSPEKDPTHPKAFRPITSLPELGKLLERCIQLSLYKTLGYQNVFSVRQFGFNKERSTIGPLRHLVELVKEDNEIIIFVFLLTLRGIRQPLVAFCHTCFI